MTDEGSEADYMWDCQLGSLADEHMREDPEFEVVRGNHNERVFEGSRAACWDYKRKSGGCVRPWSGEDDSAEYFHA